jgi:hypothetical protein
MEIRRGDTDIGIEVEVEIPTAAEIATVIATEREIDVATNHRGMDMRRINIVQGMTEMTDAAITGGATIVVTETHVGLGRHIEGTETEVAA